MKKAVRAIIYNKSWTLQNEYENRDKKKAKLTLYLWKLLPRKLRYQDLGSYYNFHIILSIFKEQIKMTG